jgi:hypothetical protein
MHPYSEKYRRNIYKVRLKDNQAIRLLVDKNKIQLIIKIIQTQVRAQDQVQELKNIAIITLTHKVITIAD